MAQPKIEWNDCNYWIYLGPNFTKSCFERRSCIKTLSSKCVKSFYLQVTWYIDIDYKDFGSDQSRTNTICNLQDKYMKAQEVVSIKNSDYNQSMELLFSDQRKFEV